MELLHIWLLPDSKTKIFLSRFAGKLSRKYHSPGIEPHLSLRIRIAENPERVKQKTHELAKTSAPFSLRCWRTEQYRDFFRGIVLRTRKSAALARLRKKANRLFSSPEGRRFVPHVSLMYSGLSKEKKQRIIRNELNGIPLILRFDRIRVVQDTARHAHWKKTAEFQLKK